MAELDLGSLVSRAVAERMTPEFVEQEVIARVDKLVVQSIERALASYSDTGKQIENAVQEALKVDKLDLPRYGSTVCAILKAQIEANVSAVVSGQLAKDMDELLSLAAKEVRLSELADLMRERHDDGYGEVITVIVADNRYGSTWVYLDEDNHYSERDKYQCACSILVSEDGTIASARLSGKDIHSQQVIGRSYGLEQRIRSMVACGSKLILDEDAVVTSIGDY